MNQLSRFTQAPRQGHVLDALRIFGFLDKWQNRGISTSGRSTINFWDQLDSRKVIYPGNMKDYYPDSKFEDISDPPTPMGDPVEVNIFVDASHADDKLDRKSVTGMLVYIGDMLIKSVSKRQKSIATSTFSSELLALKTAVEESQGIRLLLQSIGVPIKGSINIHSDSESVLKSAANPGHNLKRKHVAISYNLVRENIATQVISLWKVDTKLNPSDMLTKSLPRIPLSGHLERLQTNIKSEVN